MNVPLSQAEKILLLKLIFKNINKFGIHLYKILTLFAIFYKILLNLLIKNSLEI